MLSDSDFEQAFIKINEQYFNQLDTLQKYSEEEQPLISWSGNASRLKDKERRDKEFAYVRKQFEQTPKVELLLLNKNAQEANRKTFDENPHAFLALMELGDGKYAVWAKQNGRWNDIGHVIDPEQDECIEEIKLGYQNKQGKMVVEKNDQVADWLESKNIFYFVPPSIIYADDERYLVDGEPLRRSYLCTRKGGDQLLDADEIVDIVALSSRQDRSNGKIHLMGEGSYANVMLGQKENGDYCAVRQVTVRYGSNNGKALSEKEIQEQAELMKELGLGGGGYAIDSGYGYQVMYPVGNDLEKHLKNNPVTNLDRVKASRKVVQGLKFIHDKDYTHGDGKAGNILRVRKKELVDKNNPQSEDNYDYVWIDLDRVVKGKGDKEFSNYNVKNNKMGTSFYMPNKDSDYTRKQADVYSLAKILRTSKKADYYDFKKGCMVKNEKVRERYSVR